MMTTAGLWECPECAFTCDALHVQPPNTRCPACEEVRLSKALAEQQALVAKLREALIDARAGFELELPGQWPARYDAALALPADSSVLNALLEAERMKKASGHETCPDNPCPGYFPYCEGVGKSRDSLETLLEQARAEERELFAEIVHYSPAALAAARRARGAAKESK
jgi:hypothetical protein